MSPLADEILADLRSEFADTGASARMLCRWLGENSVSVNAALDELKPTGLISYAAKRYWPRVKRRSVNRVDYRPGSRGASA